MIKVDGTADPQARTHSRAVRQALAGNPCDRSRTRCQAFAVTCNRISSARARGRTSRRPMSRSMASRNFGTTIRPALARAAASPEMKRLTDDGALFIGRIKSYIIEEKQIIPPRPVTATRGRAERVHRLIREALHPIHVHAFDAQQPRGPFAPRRVQHADVIQIRVADFHRVVAHTLRLARRGLRSGAPGNPSRS